MYKHAHGIVPDDVITIVHSSMKYENKWYVHEITWVLHAIVADTVSPIIHPYLLIEFYEGTVAD